MFNKKNRKNQEPEYLLSSFDRLEHRIVNDRSELLDLCNVLLEHRALLANFEAKLAVSKDIHEIEPVIPFSNNKFSAFREDNPENVTFAVDKLGITTA